RERAVPADEEVAEVEELDLLGIGVGGDQRNQVVHPAQQSRRPARDVEAAPAVAGVGDERRYRREQRQQREQRADSQQQRHHAHEGDGGLHQAEGGGDHHHRAVGGVVLGPPQQVVGGGILEEGQVEAGRVLHHQE